jgi:hypothetical protein
MSVKSWRTIAGLRTGRILTGLWLAVGLFAGCHSTLPTVAVEAAPDAMQSLVGHWEGTYGSEENGREGRIQFDLAAQGDTARGEVLMLPSWTEEQYQGSSRGEPRPSRPMAAPVPLTIHFVRIEHGQILGTLDPYTDPDCDCTVTTNFIGTIDGNEVRGVFAIRGPRQWQVLGEWRAQRTRKQTK